MLSPLRVAAAAWFPAAVILFLLVLLAAQAEAHSMRQVVIQPDVWNTDNLYRWSLRNATHVVAGFTDIPSQYNFTPATNPGLVHTRRFLLLDSDPDANVPLCCGTNWGAVNVTASNWTFESPVPITTYSFKVLGACSGSCGAGTLTVYIEFRDASGGYIASSKTTGIACAATTSINGNITRALVKQVSIYADMTGGCGGTSGGTYKFTLLASTLWATGSRNDAIAYTAQELEYADYLAAVQGTLQSGSAASVSVGNAMTLEPGIVYWAYYGGESENSCSGPGLLQPQTAGTTVEAKLIGWAFDEGNGTKTITAWRLYNPDSIAQVITAQQPGGNWCNNVALTFFDTDIIHRSTWALPTSDPAGSGTIPIGQNISNPSYIQGLFGVVAFANHTGPFNTYPLQQAFNTQNAYDVDNIVSAGTLPTTTRTFYVNLTRYAYWGNALFFNLVDSGNDVICDGTTVAVTNRGSDQLTPFYTVLQNAFTEYGCMWILDDFHRTLMTPRDQYGQINGIDNSRAGTNGQYSLTLYNFPAAGGSLGSTFRQIQRFDRHGSLFVQCNEAFDACFGNLDTSGFAVAGAKTNTTWHWTVLDDNTSSPIAAANVFEFTTGVGGVTNAAGLLNVSVSVGAANWTISKTGYKPATLNFTVVSVQEWFWTVRLSRVLTQVYEPTCTFINSTAVNCTLQPGNQGCNVISGSDPRQCPVPGTVFYTKLFRFPCAVDATNPNGTQIINGVNVTESFTAFSAVTNTNMPGTGCAILETDQIQRTTVNVTWSIDGYRTLTFPATWLTANVISLTPYMVRGLGSGAIRIEAENFTIDINGTLRTLTTVKVIDTGQSIVGSTAPGSGGMDFANDLKETGAGLIGTGPANNVIWGFFIFIFFVVIGVGLYVDFVGKKASPTAGLGIAAVSSTPALGIVGFLGLWPFWYLVLASLGVGVAFLAFVWMFQRRGGS